MSGAPRLGRATIGMYSGLSPLKTAVMIALTPMTMARGITHTRFSNRIDMMRRLVERRKATAPSGLPDSGKFPAGTGKAAGRRYAAVSGTEPDGDTPGWERLDCETPGWDIPG